MKIKSFKLKLIFSYIFVVLVSFGFTAFLLDKNLEKNSLNNIQTSLIAQAMLIESQLSRERFKREDIVYLEGLAETLSSHGRFRVTVINAQGKVLADSDKATEYLFKLDNHSNRPEVNAALSGTVGIDIRHSSTIKIDMLYVAVPIKEFLAAGKNENIGVLRLALPLKSVEQTLLITRKVVFSGLLLALILAFIFGYIVAAMIIKPISRIIQVSRKFSEGEFSRRIIQPSRDDIGELALTINKMAQDIEYKIKEIKAQDQKLAAIFNSMIEGVIVIDKHGYVVSINPTVERIFGVSKKDAQGRLFLEAIRNNDIAEIINSALSGSSPLSVEIPLIYPVHRIFEINATPIYDADTINGCMVVIHDITEIRRLERVRQDFVANVSHELKTPLTSIKGFVETLLEGALDDKENNRSFLTIIQSHAERLNRLVNDLLSLSRLESKDTALEKINFNLSQLLEKIILGFKAQIEKKGIEVINDLPAGMLVSADKEKIEQVFTNLIDNAIKFNRQNGSIRIYSQETAKELKVGVEDSGLGIPEKDIPRIFERFYRVDKARSHELGGTGLGLSIVKHIIELHEGRVGVESAEGSGSNFWFILPKH